jgi:hypothetical protein
MATPAGSLGLYPNRVATTTASEGTFKRVRAESSGQPDRKLTDRNLQKKTSPHHHQIPVSEFSDQGEFFKGDPERRLRVVRMETELAIAESFSLDRTTNR